MPTSASRSRCFCRFTAIWAVSAEPDVGARRDRRPLGRGTQRGSAAGTLRPMSAATPKAKRLVLALAAASYAAVTVAFIVWESPGLGLGHLFIVPICLVALM